MAFDMKAWMKQPTTVIGIGALIGTAAGAVTHALTGSLEWSVAAGTIFGGVVHIVMPDAAGAPDAVDMLVRDAVNAAVSKNLAGALPTLLADGLAVVKAVQPQPASQLPGATFTAAPAPALLPGA